MIELFSRKPVSFELYHGTHLLPIHITDSVYSLSAILLNDDYYDFLKEGIKIVKGLPILDELHLIPFKAKAWCELNDRKLQGELGLSKHIRKHRNDIIKLLSLVSLDKKVMLKNQVLLDMKRFVESIEKEEISNIFYEIYEMDLKIIV